MEKTATLNLRVNPTLKENAESVLSKLGLPMSTAVDLFLNQIVLIGGIPFPVTLPKPPADIDLSQMSEEEFQNRIRLGYEEIKSGKTRDAKETFEQFRKSHTK